MTVVVREPGPPLGGLVRAITYQAGDQPRASVEKILPGPGTSLWVNLNRDEFRSFDDTGQVRRVPGAMLAGPTSRASVIEFEQGRAHVSVTFALGGAACFCTPPLELVRDQQVALADVWGRSGATLRDRLLEATTPRDALDVMEDVLLGHLTGPLAPDPLITAAGAGAGRGDSGQQGSGRPRGAAQRRCAGGSRRRSVSVPSASPGCSGCSGWFVISTGGLRSTGRPWPRGTVTLTSRTSRRSSGSSWA